jgi:hypothetical protein
MMGRPMRGPARHSARSERMNRIAALTCVLLAGFSAGPGPDGPRTAAPLSVRIVPSAFREPGPRRIAAKHFHAVVTNVSEEPVRLWQEWCSWGYFTLSFEVTDQDGRSAVVKKKPRGWDRNTPDWIAIPPGDHLVFDVSFSEPIWEDAPSPEGVKPRPVRMKAVYAIPADPETKKHGVWVGQVASPEEAYEVH